MMAAHTPRAVRRSRDRDSSRYRRRGHLGRVSMAQPWRVSPTILAKADEAEPRYWIGLLPGAGPRRRGMLRREWNAAESGLLDARVVLACPFAK